MVQPKRYCMMQTYLSASGFPETDENVKYLVDKGVHCIVSLTKEKKIESKELKCLNHRIPIVDFTPPTIEQADEFVNMVIEYKKSKKVLHVHCQGGLGRCGTMLACYYVHDLYMDDPEGAIKYVRCMRPESIETKDQEKLVHEYSKHLQKQNQHLQEKNQQLQEQSQKN